MTAPADTHPVQEPAPGMLAPLSHPVFRGIWVASLFSNLGWLIQGVGAAWIMTQLTTKADLVAMVQTAQMGPTLLLALAAGAIADMYDRRKVALAAISFNLVGAITLAALSFAGLVTPGVLLLGVALIGAGGALMGPAWQDSVREQVPAPLLPAAITLNSISFNIARSFGPALGGVIVAAAGGAAAFAINAIFYTPMLLALGRWKRTPEPARLPPEGLGRAIVSGVRYVFHSPPMRVVLLRTLMLAVSGAAVSSLMPLIARDVLKGGAETFGLLLGAFGLGAVTGALNIARLHRRLAPETLVRISTLVVAAGTAVIGFSTLLPLTLVALFITGAGWMLSVNELNIVIQTSAPRWVAGRALATFQAAIAGGIAMGAWMWGTIAQAYDVPTALRLSALALALLPIAGLWLRLGGRGQGSDEAQPLPDPEVALKLTPRSGPIRIELEYAVAPERAREFYGLLLRLGAIRSRTGGYGWAVARDVAQPERWIESYSCPTWLDYLRQRTRLTEAERELTAQVRSFQASDRPVKVHRWLERPFGSVRWKDDTPDVDPLGPAPL
ncbi:MFS transporter [uncultured Phenylobacterium sp.]|uniref:MFS transporter n=1 Tax=uncultured Phenylobacterium sp. TaxID=349273 RepID=UPI0025F8017F|nr:MFS transporter [uncultured Phenylobacterium sp.]